MHSNAEEPDTKFDVYSGLSSNEFACERAATRRSPLSRAAMSAMDPLIGGGVAAGSRRTKRVREESGLKARVEEVAKVLREISADLYGRQALQERAPQPPKPKRQQQRRQQDPPQSAHPQRRRRTSPPSSPASADCWPSSTAARMSP